MTHPITIRLPDDVAQAIDQAAKEDGVSRTDAVGEAIAAWLTERRERQIEAAYRDGYGALPQDAHAGEAGYQAMREAAGEPPSRSGEAA
jgi:metal-responsive CopG/Arc/MetJ family transcriptional regulator